MVKLFDLKKKGTLIVTIGRSGSHLLGDIIATELDILGIKYTNYREYFLKHNNELKITEFHKFYKSKIKILQKDSAYSICQIQDFNSKIYLSRYDKDFFDDYHVIVLERRNQLAHFFSKQLLHNFHTVIPIHIIDGINDNFDSLKSQAKVNIELQDVLHFFSEKQWLDLFARDTTVAYEDMISWNQSIQSKYKKHQYPVTFEQIFVNYKEIVDIFDVN